MGNRLLVNVNVHEEMFTNVFLANQPMSYLQLIYRLSLDPIDSRSFGHVMTFTQSSFPLYLLGLRTAFTD